MSLFVGRLSEERTGRAPDFGRHTPNNTGGLRSVAHPATLAQRPASGSGPGVLSGQPTQAGGTGIPRVDDHRSGQSVVEGVPVAIQQDADESQPK